MINALIPNNIYQILTRPWLKQFGNINNVPIDYWQDLKSKEMEYIWLTGLWQVPENGKNLAMSAPAVELYKQILPDFTESDVDGSPFAIENYTVDSKIGTFEDIRNLKQKLNSLGLKLILDFIPNHFSLVSSLVDSNPELFVTDNQGVIQNGKDPYTGSWIDTAQLDYSKDATRKFMQGKLMELIDICDGVRCDMAMLMLNSIFNQTWGKDMSNKNEFWHETITEIKKTRPNFVFIAECYWNLEIELINQGFDYVYNKSLLDALIRNDDVQLQQNLTTFPLESGVHFLENHDEPRSASIFDLERLKHAATLLNSLPGLKLYLDGQFEGRKIKLPIQLNRFPKEENNTEVQNFYKRLLE